MRATKTKTRKDQVEQVLKQANKIAHDAHETSQAWLRLCRALEGMIEPEARMPRFKELLDAVWVAATNEEA